MVSYQFDVEDELWNEWKDTVPRSKSLHERLTELIEADRDGRVVDSAPAQEKNTEPVQVVEKSISNQTSTTLLDNVEFPATRDHRECIDAVEAAYDYLEENGRATMRDFVNDVMPDHSLGYDVPKLNSGDRYRGAWWRAVVKPGLQALPDVASPPSGGSEWRIQSE